MLMHHDLLRRTAIAATVAAAFPGIAFGQAAAKVDFAIGNATATGADGRPRPLSKGTEVFEGDVINTGKGRLQLRFADGAQMALQPDTDFKIEKFRFVEKGGGQDGVVMNLIKGGMRTITGVIGRANRNAYALNTPSATIGIRGTEFTAEMGDTLRAFCVQGLIFLGNQGGGLLLASGQGAFVSNFTTQPARDDNKPSLPTISKQEMEVLLTLAGVDPKNPTQDFNPVVTLQTALAQLGGGALTGRMTGNWAAIVGQQTNFPGAVVNQPITFDSTGKLVQFDDSSASYSTSLGTATSTSLGNDGIVAWGKWSNGTTAGVNPAFSNKDLSSGPIHYVAGLPASSLPTTGLATYSLLGYSASCMGNGCTKATVAGSNLVVNFATSTVGLSMGLTVDGGAAGTYQYSGSGSALSSGKFNLSGTFIGSSGSASNSFHGAGFLSGSGALRAGLAWDGFVGQGSTYVTGANAYTQSALVASPAVPPPLLTGSFTGSWGAAISSASSYTSQPVVLDSAGKLAQFNDPMYSTTTGTATVSSLGNDGTIAWGRWMNGTTSGMNPTFSSQNLASTGPLHYVVGLPVSAMPVTGTATYNMMGSSTACSGGGCTVATVNSSSLNVNFGTSTVGLAMNLTLNGSYGGNFTYSGTTGALGSAGGFSVSGQLTGGSTGCQGSLNGSGFLSGAGATRAGLAWNGSVPFGTSVAGTVAYTK